MGVDKFKVTFAAAEGRDPCDAQAIWLRRLLPCLKARGIEPRVLFFAVERPDVCKSLDVFREHGIQYRITRNRGTTGNLVRWFLTELQMAPPDVFVPHHVVWALYAARWAKEAGIPTVCVLHNDDDPCRALIRQFGNRESSFGVSSFVAVSEQIRNFALQMVSQRTPVEVIPCGVPVPSVPVLYDGGALRVCYFGRLIEKQKRISDVSRAFCRACRELPGVEAYIYGAGSQESLVKKILAEEGQGLNITFGGALDNEAALREMRSCHAVVLLSEYEGTPTVLMEAMANGLVPIATQIGGGTEELVEHEVTGLLVSDRGEEVVRSIDRLRNPALWSMLSRSARSRVAAHFSADGCADKWADFLGRLSKNSDLKNPIRIPRSFDFPAPLPSLARERRVPWFLDAPLGWLVAAKTAIKERGSSDSKSGD